MTYFLFFVVKFIEDKTKDGINNLNMSSFEMNTGTVDSLFYSSIYFHNLVTN